MCADKLFEAYGFTKLEYIWEEDGQVHEIYYRSEDTKICFGVDNIDFIDCTVDGLLYEWELKAVYKKMRELSMKRKFKKFKRRLGFHD